MEGQHPLQVLCATFAVSRSGYYAWRQRPPSLHQQTDVQLLQQLEVVHRQSRATYGSPRLLAALRAQGLACSRKRIARLMRQRGLCGRQRRRFRPVTTDSDHAEPIAPNRLAQMPPASATNTLWVSDITYVPTEEGWLYVAGVMDRYSRRLVGWAFGSTLHTSLVLDALQMALRQRRPPAGLVHHSDRGSQYASADYRQALQQARLVASMSRAACCYDNAAMESFWSSLKNELVHRTHFVTRAQACAALFEWIEIFYNRQRLHSALGYKSPVDFENQNN